MQNLKNIHKMKKENTVQNTTKPMAYDALLAIVLPKWDCDDCKYYPCVHQEMTAKTNKLRYNECGDHSERGTP